MAICAFSLMGFPPTAGLLGKVYVFWSAFSVDPVHEFRTGLVVLAVIAVINSAIGAAYYLRIAGACYLREGKAEVRPTGGPMLRVALAACCIAMLVLFFLPTPLARQARMAMHNITTSAVTLAAPTAAQANSPQ
jgi:NADH-quinone oxidoreductase subunit N